MMYFFTNKRSMRVKNTVVDPADETVCLAEPEVETNVGCQVRRKIEDYLERRRFQDEIGDLETI
jgi:hypothetical protein